MHPGPKEKVYPGNLGVSRQQLKEHYIAGLHEFKAQLSLITCLITPQQIHDWKSGIGMSVSVQLSICLNPTPYI